MKRLGALRMLPVLLALGGAALLLLLPVAGQAGDGVMSATPAVTELPGGTIPPIATPLFLPAVAANPPTPTPTALPPPTATPTPTTPVRVFASVPVAGGAIGRPAEESPDVNLAIRSYTATVAYLGLVNYNGDTDSNAPQMDDLFSPARLPVFAATHQVYDWNWSCNPPDGCRGEPINDYVVTLLEMATTPGETVTIPSRGPQIYAGGFKAMVLYATEERITLVYTREDTPAAGYVIHLEEVAVAPELVALYRKLDGEGRRQLPALRNGEVLGTAGTTLKVAVRDTGRFMDPRACKDWWMAYMGQCTVQMERPRGGASGK